jgi:ribonucleotide monophosphatase NagD (HAD superfamily)
MHYLDLILAFRHAFDPARTIMVGDNLDTDIAFGRNGGISTLLVMSGAYVSFSDLRCLMIVYFSFYVCTLVLSGVTTEKTLLDLGLQSVVPNYIISSFGDLQVCYNEESNHGGVGR